MESHEGELGAAAGLVRQFLLSPLKRLLKLLANTTSFGGRV